MSIKLYEHNQIAYKSAVEMLAGVGKAAVIHPTGTGKSFIGFKLCEDNPTKTICWLSPSQYIFATQIENLKNETDDTADNRLDDILSNVKFYTYAKLMNMSTAELEAINPDYIILDEFHRCGAAEWGQGVDRLLEMYKGTPILGFSATAIRYLDNQRDMSDELFDKHIASEMTLGESIVRGILNPPKYILSIYSYKEELRRYEEKLKSVKNETLRDRAEEYLEKLRRALENAEGLDVIFDKHMTDRRGKYIVFCANFEAMQEAVNKVGEWFSLVDAKPYIYRLYSDDPGASREFAEFKDNRDDSHLRLLFCIDALNEGVHVENVSGVILLRPMVSPIIYKQQIGRALSASKKTKPVVFDIVNNIQSLYSIDAVREEMDETIELFRSRGEADDIINDTFEVTDEVQNCIELFNSLEDTLSVNWDTMYSEARRYYQANGDLLVPAAYITDTGFCLGRWIRTQRIAGVQGALSREQTAKLDAIGMVWKAVYKSRWLTNYELAKKYYEEHGNLTVSRDYEVTGDDNKSIKLGVWVFTQRERYEKGQLSNEQIEVLTRIGMSWDRHEDKWEMGFDYAKRYAEEYGDINFVPIDFEYDDFNISKWLHTQRTRHKQGKLAADREKKLEELGFKWSVNEAFWDKGYENALKYKKLHGNLVIPKDYECSDGFKLKSWINNQKVRRQKGTLSDIQIAKLESIGCI